MRAHPEVENGATDDVSLLICRFRLVSWLGDFVTTVKTYRTKRLFVCRKQFGGELVSVGSALQTGFGNPDTGMSRKAFSGFVLSLDRFGFSSLKSLSASRQERYSTQHSITPDSLLNRVELRWG